MPLCASPVKLCTDNKARVFTQKPGDCWEVLSSQVYVVPNLAKQQIHDAFRLEEKEKAAQARDKKKKKEQKRNELCVFGGH